MSLRCIQPFFLWENGLNICTKKNTVLDLSWGRKVSAAHTTALFLPCCIHDHRCRGQARAYVCEANKVTQKPKIPTRHRSTLAPGFPASLSNWGCRCCPMKPTARVRRSSEQEPAVACAGSHRLEEPRHRRQKRRRTCSSSHLTWLPFDAHKLTKRAAVEKHTKDTPLQADIAETSYSHGLPNGELTPPTPPGTFRCLGLGSGPSVVTIDTFNRSSLWLSRLMC